MQADPAFNVEARPICTIARKLELERINKWMDAAFRDSTRVALHYLQAARASGRLRLVPRKPEIACDTGITNVLT